MKRIKLFLLKAEYFFNYHTGPYLVNERKYGQYLQDLIRLQVRIQELESDLKDR
jgi:hypothetical protein